MFGETLAAFVGSQRNRPLSVAVAVGSLFLPASLILFLAKPALFFKLTFPTLLLLSASISLPILILCFGITYTPLFLMRMARGGLQDMAQDDDITKTMARYEALEWPCFLAGSWLANTVLFFVAAIAYYKPLRIGATMILVATVLSALWLLVFLPGFASVRRQM